MSRKSFSRASFEMKSPLSSLVTVSGMPSVGKKALFRAAKSEFGFAWPLVRFFRAEDVMIHFALSRGITLAELEALELSSPREDSWHRCNHDLSNIGEFNHNWIGGQMVHVFAPRGFHVRLICPMQRRLENLSSQGLVVSADQLAKQDESLKTRFDSLFPGCLWADEDFDLVIDTSEVSIADALSRIVEEHQKWQGKHAWKTSFYSC